MTSTISHRRHRSRPHPAQAQGSCCHVPPPERIGAAAGFAVAPARAALRNARRRSRSRLGTARRAAMTSAVRALGAIGKMRRRAARRGRSSISRSDRTNVGRLAAPHSPAADRRAMFERRPVFLERALGGKHERRPRRRLGHEKLARPRGTELRRARRPRARRRRALRAGFAPKIESTPSLPSRAPRTSAHRARRRGAYPVRAGSMPIASAPRALACSLAMYVASSAHVRERARRSSRPAAGSTPSQINATRVASPVARRRVSAASATDDDLRAGQRAPLCATRSQSTGARSSSGAPAITIACARRSRRAPARARRASPDAACRRANRDSSRRSRGTSAAARRPLRWSGARRRSRRRCRCRFAAIASRIAFAHSANASSQPICTNAPSLR